MDQAGSQAGSLLAPGRGLLGAASTADVASTAGLALAGAATMEAGRPSPGGEDSAVGSVTVTPDVPTAAVDVHSVVAHVHTVAVDTPSVAEGVPSVVVAAPLVVAVMVAGAVRFHHQLNVLGGRQHSLSAVALSKSQKKISWPASATRLIGSASNWL